MNAVQTHTPAPLVFTQSAANKVYELIKEEQNLNLNLRVYVTGGGCSGFQYGFAFEESIAEDDTIIEKEVKDEEGESGAIVKLVIDPMSFTYLVGAQIDFKDGLEGPRFIIRNPNAQTTCGCGSSFSA